jgi:uncharacterized membrane protein
MHWIVIGVLIFIGFSLAPLVIAAAIVAIPFVVGAIVGGVLGGLIFQDIGPVLIGALIGGILPYVLMSRTS